VAIGTDARGAQGVHPREMRSLTRDLCRRWANRQTCSRKVSPDLGPSLIAPPGAARPALVASRFACDQKARLDASIRHHGPQPLPQFRTRLVQGFDRHWGQAFQDEPHSAASVPSRVRTLTPVPAATGHASIVPPDDLARLRRFLNCLTILHRLKDLGAGCDGPARLPYIRVKIFSTDW
jgi:hypothetical protein